MNQVLFIFLLSHMDQVLLIFFQYHIRFKFYYVFHLKHMVQIQVLFIFFMRCVSFPIHTLRFSHMAQV